VLHTEYDEAARAGLLKVSGSAGSIYTIGLSAVGSFECDCPDSIRPRPMNELNMICKHRCFVLYKVAGGTLDQVYPTSRLQHLALKKVRECVKGPVLLSPKLSKPRLRARYKELASGSDLGQLFYAKTPSDESEGNCGICYKALAEGALLSCPDCKNTLHKDCIVRWV
jgi:hypothetical protein